jgi:hypothetical protein
MNNKVIAVTLMLSAVAGITAAVQSPKQKTFSTQISSNKSAPTGEIKALSSYVLPAEEELFAASDMIFVGKVIEFSPSFWNYDNNAAPSSIKEWESTPNHIYHQVNIKVIRPILGTKAGQVIHVNVLESSPVKSKLKIGSDTFFTEADDSNLKVGSKGVFLVNSRGKSSWRTISGRSFVKRTITFSAYPGISYLPEKNGSYLQDNQPITLEKIQSKVRQYTPARSKFSREFKLN